MRSLVYLEVLRAGEHFAAAGERACERLLSSVRADVVDQLVFGLEGRGFTRAFLPAAHMSALLRTPHVLHRDVRDQLVHGAVGLAADPPVALLRVDPLAHHLLFDALLPRVAEEGLWVVVGHARPHVGHAVLAIRVASRSMVELFSHSGEPASKRLLVVTEIDEVLVALGVCARVAVLLQTRHGPEEVVLVDLVVTGRSRCMGLAHKAMVPHQEIPSGARV